MGLLIQAEQFQVSFLMTERITFYTVLLIIR